MVPCQLGTATHFFTTRQAGQGQREGELSKGLHRNDPPSQKNKGPEEEGEKASSHMEYFRRGKLGGGDKGVLITWREGAERGVFPLW